MFHQQDAQGSKGLPGQFLRGAKVDFFVGSAKVFAYKGVGIAQPGGGQRGTQGGRGLGPAGEKEYGFMVHAGGYRVAGTAVGRNKSPALPGAPTAAASSCTLERPGSTRQEMPKARSMGSSWDAPE